MSGQNEIKSDVMIDELAEYSDKDQAEQIASHYASISQQYTPVSLDHFPEYKNLANFRPPKVTCSQVEKTIKSMNKKAACVPGDVPLKVIAGVSFELARPLTHLINSCLEKGVYPKMWKLEYVTPVPKVHPPEKLTDLRKISGLMNFSKITDKILAQYIVDDMKLKRDKTQYGNQKNLSIQHYLVKMLDTILKNVDQNSSKKSIAVLLGMIDWSQAFDRLSHVLGVKSFIENGVRGSLIPILVNFFQDRQMKVKWKGLLSTIRDLPGGGTQGGTLGIEEYLSQTNNNINFLSEEEGYKFIDDLSILEIINLLSISLSSYDVQSHVPSDVAVDNYYLNSQNIKFQGYLDQLSEWTTANEMKLNCQKSKYMIFNFSRNYPFNTRLHINSIPLDQVHETRLLGLVVRDDLSWKSNTKLLVRRAYSRMPILRKLFDFGVPVCDLIHIYILYIRSVLEQSAVVWHSSLTDWEETTLERVQKVALRLILKENYLDYAAALDKTGLQTLASRRDELCLNFAKKCVKFPHTKDMFPQNEKIRVTRKTEKYSVPFARTDRYKNSSIPYMSRLLNANT